MTSPHLTGAERVVVPVSLLLSYLANDGEELMTMPGTTSAPSWAPVPPWLKRPITPRHAATAIGVIGALCAAATVDGVRSAGRGAFYRDAQLAFGAHGVVHLAASAGSRGYTTGVVTAPLVLLQWGYASRRLRAAGIAPVHSVRRAATLAVVMLQGAHALGAAVEHLGQGRDRARERP